VPFQKKTKDEQPRTYHTSFKDLVRLGICPQYILDLIPRANIYRWRKESESKYFGRDDIEPQQFQSIILNIQKHPGYFFRSDQREPTSTGSQPFRIFDVCPHSQDVYYPIIISVKNSGLW